MASSHAMTKLIDRLFFDHPRSVGESYAEHLAMAFGFGWRMAVAGIACMIHALLPAVFANTASRTVLELEGVMRDRAKGRLPARDHAMAEHEFAWVI